jgi:GntR family transcriptional regulator
VIIDKNSQIPLHTQLAALLKAQIVAGVFAPNTSLPSEREMCEQYNISRTTVREALHQLEKDGLIQRHAGKGIYVADNQQKMAIHVSLKGFTSDVKREGGFPSSNLVSANVISYVPHELIERMKLEKSDEVVKIIRLRSNNGVPVALHTVYINHRLCPGILDHNLSQVSLFNILMDQYGINLAHAEEQIYAGLANQEELKMLTLSYPSAVLRSERTTFTDAGEVIEFSQATYCGESYRMIVDLDAQNSIK